MSVLLGCTGVVEEAELVLPDPATVSRNEPVLADEISPPQVRPPIERAAGGPRCTWEPAEAQRPARLTAPPETATCRAQPSRRRKAELRRQVRERWMWSWPDHAKLSVSMGCDRLEDSIASLVFELSSGHGGSLELVKLDHLDGGDWQITRIDYNHYYGVERGPHEPGDPWVEDSTGVVLLSSGTLPGPRVDAALRRARQALALEIEEHAPPPDPEGIVTLGSMGFSSRDFHVALRLVDTRGHGAEYYVAGYESGGEGQAQRIALDLAADELVVLLADEALMTSLDMKAARDPAFRELFARRLWAARDRGEDYGSWYLRERLLGLAAPLGSEQHMSALLEQVAAKGDVSVDRSRVLAINAIAAITGFDPRYGERGEVRDVDEVAAEVLAACGG